MNEHEHGLNYFNYYTEIEDTFIRRRGKHIWLSTTDWALIETWKEMGIPLHVALRGVERSFDSWEAKPRKRTIKTLLYCEEEVEAQYAEWLESRLGAGGENETCSSGTNDGLPFPKSEILRHLESSRSELMKVSNERRLSGGDELANALERAATLLFEVQEEFIKSSSPNAKKLEDSLTGLERLLSDAIKQTIPDAVLQSITSEVKRQLRPYRSHMEKAVYRQTFENLLLKQLREKFSVPRLSLFYL